MAHMNSVKKDEISPGVLTSDVSIVGYAVYTYFQQVHKMNPYPSDYNSIFDLILI